jgi:fucose permease
MTPTLHRDRSTWLMYLLLAFYAYFINILGPITPFLKQELALSYTASSLHFTAFAVGILLVGLGGHPVIRRLGQWRALWLGALGISGGAFVLLAGRAAALTIGASFCMGLVGSLILVLVPSVLSEQHGERRTVAISEANVIASLVAAAAPLLVGWSTRLPGGWRLALGTMACVPLLLLLAFRRAAPQPSAFRQDPSVVRRTLPSQFWVYWVALVLAVSVEFCMISWSADYLENHLGMLKVGAAQSISLFLAAMIVGRLAVSRLVQHFSARSVAVASIVVASTGFGLFWLAGTATLGLVGLFITGLGVAGLYPLLLSLAIGVTGSNAVQASARATLASGTAILALPLVLGRLADIAGIRPAYGVVAVLLIGLLLIVAITGRASAIRPA